MVSLQELTVAQVSGLIAAAVFVVQFLVPIALPVILLGLLRPRSKNVTETAVSWYLYHFRAHVKTTDSQQVCHRKIPSQLAMATDPANRFRGDYIRLQINTVHVFL
jgi:hypothetical protein